VRGWSNAPWTWSPRRWRQGETVKLSGFGVFQVRDKRARMGRNPKTGEPAEIEPRRVIGFRASQVMKARIDRALGG
jgi:integration host factor subunit alpha